MADADLKITYRDPAKLLGNPRNARIHGHDQVRELRAAIDAFGFNAPVALLDDGLTIGAGHGRQLAALLDPPLRRIPTITIRGLTDAQWRAYVIADNRLAERSTWNYDLLREELGQLQAFDTTLAGLAGFSVSELSAMLNLTAPPTLAELEAKFGTPAASDFWPEIRMQAPPALKKRFEAMLIQARPGGAEPHQRLAFLLDAVDASRLTKVK